MKKEENLFKGVKKRQEKLKAMPIEKRIKKFGKEYILEMFKYLDDKRETEPRLRCPNCLRVEMEFGSICGGGNGGWHCLWRNCLFDFRNFPRLLPPNPDGLKTYWQGERFLTERIRMFLKSK